jgi:hypothetical protein
LQNQCYFKNPKKTAKAEDVFIKSTLSSTSNCEAGKQLGGLSYVARFPAKMDAADALLGEDKARAEMPCLSPIISSLARMLSPFVFSSPHARLKP